LSSEKTASSLTAFRGKTYPGQGSRADSRPAADHSWRFIALTGGAPLAGSKTKFSLWTAPAKIKTPYKVSIFFLLLINLIVGRMCDLSLRL
jgi:hypothetical protein